MIIIRKKPRRIEQTGKQDGVDLIDFRERRALKVKILILENRNGRHTVRLYVHVRGNPVF